MGDREYVERVWLEAKQRARLARMRKNQDAAWARFEAARAEWLATREG